MQAKVNKNGFLKGLDEQLAALQYLPRFLKMVYAVHPLYAITNILLRVFKSAIPPLALYVGKLIIDEIIALAGREAASDLTNLWWLIGIEFALAIASELINRVIILLDVLLGDLFANESSVLLMEHAGKLDLEQFENPVFYDKLERARQQTVNRVVLLSQLLSQFQDMVTLLFLGIGLVAFNPWLILILVVAVIPSFLGETHFNQRNYSLSRSWTPQRRELDYLRYIGASNETAKEVKSFGLSSFLSTRFKQIADDYYHQNKKLAFGRASWGSLFSALGTAAYYGAYVFIVVEAVAGSITIGDLTFLAGSFNRMQNMLQAIMGRFSGIANRALYLKDLFDFLAIKPRITSPTVYAPMPRPIKEGYVFEDVGFKYPGSEEWAVRHLSFALKAREKLALVGENGAGKTTVVKLLSRLYEPTEGRITLDGKELSAYRLEDLRQAVGTIYQDYVRFQLTAEENIAVGNIDSRSNRDKIQDAAQKSLADSIISRLPNGYAQVLGRRFHKGVDLSGGEWQKIALARAYMRDAELLILDEPTSALDARAEHEVFRRFTELTASKTAVLISHRFSTVRIADRILVLGQGQLLELGTHEELIAENGKYAELFSLQAAGYV